MNGRNDRPSVREVYDFLRSHDALIVHFSGVPKGTGHNTDLEFPEDLRSVINGDAQGGVSCSVVKPGDEFADMRKANATGCIGVVLGLNSPDSLVAIHPHDCGSWVDDNGNRSALPMHSITWETMKSTLTNRPTDPRSGRYNEWIVRDYEVLGVFAARPYRIWKTVPSPGSSIALTSVEEVLGYFRGQRVIGFHENGIVDCNSKEALRHEIIYRPNLLCHALM